MRLTFLCVYGAAIGPSGDIAQIGPGRSNAAAEGDRGSKGVEIVGNVTPISLERTEEQMAQLALPPDNAIGVSAHDTGDFRMMRLSAASE